MRVPGAHEQCYCIPRSQALSRQSSDFCYLRPTVPCESLSPWGLFFSLLHGAVLSITPFSRKTYLAPHPTYAHDIMMQAKLWKPSIIPSSASLSFPPPSDSSCLHAPDLWVPTGCVPAWVTTDSREAKYLFYGWASGCCLDRRFITWALRSRNLDGRNSTAETTRHRNQ